jgi:hypothetical protein
LMMSVSFDTKMPFVLPLPGSEGLLRLTMRVQRR